jgi:hypothetical protein
MNFLKSIISFLLLFSLVSCYAQGGIKISELQEQGTVINDGYIPIVIGGVTKRINISKIKKADDVYFRNDSAFVVKNGILQGYKLASGADTLPGGAFTSLPSVGFNPGSNLTPTQIIKAAYYDSQKPIATLTGGQQVELMVGGANVNYTLNWSAKRQIATHPITSIAVNGINQTFTQPSALGTVNGTYVAPVQRNVTNTFKNIVTTDDGKADTASTTFTFLPKRYFGWLTTNTPADADLIAAGGELTSNYTKTWTQAAPGSSKYLVFAYPASFGVLPHIDINGFPSIASFNLTTRSVTNASGYTQSYNIYVSVNQFTVTGTTSIATY